MSDPLLVLRYVSYVVTAVIAIGFVRRRLLLDSYIEGLWEGELVDPQDRDFRIRCDLLLVRSYGRPVRGYCRFLTLRGACELATGIDQLTVHEGRQFLPRRMSATFAREFYYDYETLRADRSSVVYKYQFAIPAAALIALRRMTVKTWLATGREVTGVFHRSSL